MYLRFPMYTDKIADKLRGQQPLLVYKTRDPRQHKRALQYAAAELRKQCAGGQSWCVSHVVRSAVPKGFWSMVVKEAERQAQLYKKRYGVKVYPIQSRAGEIRGKLQHAVRDWGSPKLAQYRTIKNGQSEIRALFRGEDGWACARFTPSLKLKEYRRIPKPATEKRRQACLLERS